MSSTYFQKDLLIFLLPLKHLFCCYSVIFFFQLFPSFKLYLSYTFPLILHLLFWVLLLLEGLDIKILSSCQNTSFSFFSQLQYHLEPFALEFYSYENAKSQEFTIELNTKNKTFSADSVMKYTLECQNKCSLTD